jgi:TPR repeat protein
VPQDEAMAVQWFHRAAAQGHVTAQFNLGVAYAKGTGVPQDHAEAVQWYRRAAIQGDAEAQFGLSAMYVTGIGLGVLQVDGSRKDSTEGSICGLSQTYRTPD